MNVDRPLGDVQERQAIAKLDREDLEDKFLRLREQNLVSDNLILLNCSRHFNIAIEKNHVYYGRN